MLTALAAVIVMAPVTAIAVKVAPALVPEMPTGHITAAMPITLAATISMRMDLGMAGIMEEREVVEEVVVVEAIVAGVEAVVAVKNS